MLKTPDYSRLFKKRQKSIPGPQIHLLIAKKIILFSRSLTQFLNLILIAQNWAIVPFMNQSSLDSYINLGLSPELVVVSGIVNIGEECVPRRGTSTILVRKKDN